MALLPHPIRRTILLTLTLAWSTAAAAAGAVPHVPSEYTLREWHEQDGLPSDELAGVVQDSEGFLLVATNSGLSRFDGAAFEPIDVPSGGYIRGIALIRGSTSGAPVIPAIPGNQKKPTREAGYFVLRDGTFQFEPDLSLADKSPQEIFATPDGALWLGCDDGTVLHRRGDTSAIFAPPDGLTGKRTPAFATDAAGRLWIARGNRLDRLDGTHLTEIPFDSPEPELRIVSSTTGGIWVFTRTALLRWTGSSFEETVRLPELLGAHFVQAALEDSHGYVWAGTRSQGLFRIVGRDILPVPTSSEYITGVCEDSDGNIWATTNGGGLSRLRPKAHQLYDQTSGLKDNFSFTVAEDAAGAIWLANRDGGMARIKDGNVDPISRRAGWRAFSAMSVYPSPDGRVWMTSGIGVFHTLAYTPTTVERVTALNHLRSVRATFVSTNGDYWLAVDPDRVARWRDGQLTTFGPDEGFNGGEVRAFAEDSSGRIWVGAAEGRLYQFSGDRFQRLPFPGAEDCGALQVIRFGSDGCILLGTTRRGVVVFPEGDTSRPRALDSDHGLPSNNITQILTDDHDRTWFASRTGIFWVHGRHLRDFAAGRSEIVHAIVLGKDDGLPYLSCLGLFQPAAWKASDGTLWFATRRGMLRTDPALLASSGGDAPPPVAITSITCDGRRQPLDTTIELPSTARKIQLRLSALNLSAPESVQVRYRLDGFDTDWVIQGKDRLVTYPRLPPGRYVFSTMASNGSGAWSSQPALLRIVVTPPWWQSVWALIACLLALVAVVGAAVRKWSNRRLRRRLVQSEHARAIERERTRIARNIHDDVGATLTRISLLTQAAQEESGAPSPTLDKIYEATRAITRSMDEIVWAVNPRHDNTESLVYYLINYAQNFLETAGIRCRIESPGVLPDTPLTSQTRHHLFLCCKEALNNAVKHARATEVSVRISLESDRLALAISDNGHGIAASCPSPSGVPRASSGNGLRNMQQRMADVHGLCTIASVPQGGTTITFTVPIQPAPMRKLADLPPRSHRSPPTR